MVRQLKIQCPNCKRVYMLPEGKEVVTCEICKKKIFCLQIEDGKNILELEVAPGRRARIVIERKKNLPHCPGGGPPVKRRV